MAVDLTANQSTAGELRRWWFCLVSEISDIALQRRTWLDLTNRNPHWSYIEFVESFPDRDQLLQARREGWLTPDELEILNELSQAIDAYSPPKNDRYDHVAILDDPAWRAVAQIADRAKRRLAMAADQRERRMLLGGQQRS